MTKVYRFIKTKFCNFQLYVAFFEILQLSMHISNLNGGKKPRLRYSTSILTFTGPVVHELEAFQKKWLESRDTVKLD